jgi:putative heme-binding domain-containing protein
VWVACAGAGLEAEAIARLPGTRIAWAAGDQNGDRSNRDRSLPSAAASGRNEPRGTIGIAGARFDVEEPTVLILATDPHPADAVYAFEVGGERVAYSFAGVEAVWERDGEPASGQSLVWPHLDLDAVRRLTAGSRVHERQLESLAAAGTLALRVWVRLPKRTTLTLEAGGALTFEEGTLGGEDGQFGDDRRRIIFRTTDSEPAELFVVLATGGDGPPRLRATMRTEADPTERPLPREALRLPWVPPSAASPAAPGEVAEATLTGGDPVRGEAVFFSEAARCANCHRVDGRGAEVGPDLSNLSDMSLATLAREIAEPSATIHPDYVPYTVSLKDGRVLAGLVRAEGAELLRIVDPNAQETRVARSEVEQIRPTATSIMPVGLVGVIGEQGFRDLLAYLTARRTPSEAGSSK